MSLESKKLEKNRELAILIHKSIEKVEAIRKK
jgi:hypothetical protein